MCSQLIADSQAMGVQVLWSQIIRISEKTPDIHGREEKIEDHLYVRPIYVNILMTSSIRISLMIMLHWYISSVTYLYRHDIRISIALRYYNACCLLGLIYTLLLFIGTLNIFGYVQSAPISSRQFLAARVELVFSFSQYGVIWTHMVLKYVWPSW